MNGPAARDFIDILVDKGSFARWDREPLSAFGVHGDPSASYVKEITQARIRTGLDEAVITGEGRLAGRRIAILACEFGFLGGSIGVSAAERLVGAIERATAQGLPVIAAPASGGTRMQEGAVGFLQMVKITSAVMAHKAAGLPYLVYLRHPCTGGVFASWGSLGHVTLCEPGALIGFLGPRVYRALHGADFPGGVQTGENLVAHGLIDGVVAPVALRAVVRDLLAVMAGSEVSVPNVDEQWDVLAEPVPAWESVARSRREDRPGVVGLLRSAANTVTVLNGGASVGGRTSVVLALARFGASGCVVIGQDRQCAARPIGPAALREAQRGMRLAAETGLPLVSVIDTSGAALSAEAEEGGLAREIARCIATLTMLPTPTLSLVLGQGSGGGALAMLPADRVLCAQHGWIAPLSPEGAAAIRFRDPGRAAEMAEAQGVRSVDLLRHGIVDRVLSEHPDAAEEPGAFFARVLYALEGELATLAREPVAELVRRRSARYRHVGTTARIGAVVDVGGS